MNIWDDRTWKPMMLKEINKPFTSKEYIFEIKYDGIRVCIFVSKNEFTIKTRNNIDITYLFPELKSIQKKFTKNTILDGEIIMMDNNKPSFEKLLNRIHLKNKNKIETESINNPVIFVGFDILYQDKDLTNLKILDRKKILDRIKENGFFIKSKVYLYDGIKLFNIVKELDLEGIVAKRIDSNYEINTRSMNWIKIKNFKEEEFLIGGYILKKNNYISILLGELKNNKLLYVGNVSLYKNSYLYNRVIKSKIVKKSPFCNYDENDVYYINPNLKCNVIYIERTTNNHLRQPVVKE